MKWFMCLVRWEIVNDEFEFEWSWMTWIICLRILRLKFNFNGLELSCTEKPVTGVEGHGVMKLLLSN